MPASSGALSHVRVCDFTGQLAGAGATKVLAAFGAQVIRIEDPVRQGRWDILRGAPPFLDERRGVDLGGGFNNHNTEKLGITLNLRTERGRELLERLVCISDVVAENFASGVMERLGFGYERLRELRPDVVYVSNSGFGASGPYRSFKTWGPVVQAISGLTFTSGLPEREPAGWGYSYMDHTGAYVMAIAILMALYHRARTGEGQWVDMACTEAGATLTGPAILDWSVNGRPMRRPGMPHSNRSDWPPMAPHGIYPALGDDSWIAIACRDDADWQALASVVDPPFAREARFAALAGRLAAQDDLDAGVARWTKEREAAATARALVAAGVPAAVVARPEERIERDPNTAAWGLWPEVRQTAMGRVRVDGLPVHLSRTDWSIARGAPSLGEHNDRVYGELLGLAQSEIDALRGKGVI
ncbi:MAG TPA: CoA transferase [Candidatus Binatia bacterium]|nr:CoA transferase [Candidatus Binatia bacterium]